MFKSLLSVLVVMITSMALIACNTNTPNQNVGIATGAIVGGLAGSAIGAGTGQVVAIGAGAVIGGLIGGAIGESMDRNDNARMNTALNQNQKTYWVNKRTHRSYVVVPTKKVYVKGYSYCRKYYTIVKMSGKKQRVYGVACRRADGTWVAVR